MNSLVFATFATGNPGKLPIMAIGAGILVCFVVFVITLIRFCMTRKASWLVLFLISLLGGAVLSGMVIQRSFEAVRNKKNPMSTHDGAVSFNAPWNWKPMSNLHEDASLQAGNGRLEQYFIVISDSKKDYDGSLQNFAELTSSAILGSLQEGKRTDPKALLIDGQNALQYELTGAVDSETPLGMVDVSYLHTSVETPDAFHQLLMWTIKSKRNSAFPVYESVLRSVTLPSRGPAADTATAPDKVTLDDLVPPDEQ